MLKGVETFFQRCRISVILRVGWRNGTTFAALVVVPTRRSSDATFKLFGVGVCLLSWDAKVRVSRLGAVGSMQTSMQVGTGVVCPFRGTRQISNK